MCAVCACVFVCAYAHICICTYVRMYVCAEARTYVSSPLEGMDDMVNECIGACSRCPVCRWIVGLHVHIQGWNSRAE